MHLGEEYRSAVGRLELGYPAAMNQHSGGGPPHAVAPQYVDDPVQPRNAASPYAPPQHYGYAVQPGRGGARGEWVACPRCGSPYVNKATFTWWGGVVGPLIIPEVKCATCGHSYNGKTGGPLGAAIAIYLVVVLTFVFAFVAVGLYLAVTQL